MSQASTMQPPPTSYQPVSTEVLKNRLMFIGLLLMIVGLLLEGLREIIFIAFRVTIFGVMTLLSGIILLGVAAVLFIRMKYLLSLNKLDLNVIFDDPMLKILTYLAPLYVLFRGIAFFGGNVIIGIGLSVAGVLFLILSIMYQMYRYRGISPTMMLLFSILVIITGVFLSVGGFIDAGSSAPNILLAHSGILGIAVMLIGIGLIIAGFTGQAAGTTIRIMLTLGYLIAAIALVAGGGLGIRDGVNALRGRAGGVFMAMGALLLVAEILGLIAGIMFLIIIIVSLGKEISKAAAPPPPPQPPQAPPPPPPQ